jgi:hypothetical protein
MPMTDNDLELFLDILTVGDRQDKRHSDWHILSDLEDKVIRTLVAPGRAHRLPI